MLEIRWHGRGGQGAVTGAQLLAEAAFFEGKQSQAFPFFGAERRGAPVLAFTRISSKPIFIHSQILFPDLIIILDSTLLTSTNPVEGLKKDGVVIVNSKKKDFQKNDFQTYVVDATGISLRNHILVAGTPVINTSILGAITKVTKIVSMEGVLKTIQKKFSFSSRIMNANMKAAEEAFEETILIE
ncbi:MAG: 2-oxoacid:acceptor oxidoreductase family protein [Candidatus Ranarchaeia archaeon]